MNKGIRAEVRWLIAVCVGAVMIGISLDAVLPSLLLGLVGFIAWLLMRLNKLETWVRTARKYRIKADDFGGVYGEIADDVRLLSKRYQKDVSRLRSVVNRVQEMTSALADAVVVVDKNGKIEWWNRAAQKLLKFEPNDIGHRLVNFIRNPDFVDYFEGDDFSKPLEINNLRRDRQHLEFRIHPYGQGERLIVVRDVTRLKRLERMRRDFVTNVSHELRTPLTVIQGYIEVLLDKDDMPASAKGALTHVHDQSKRMAMIVNDLITLSRLETDENSSQSEHVELRPLLETIIADARALSGEQNHAFALQGDIHIALIGDKHELQSAFSNLIFNAVKYSPGGGNIDINVRSKKMGVSISIEDQGPGIHPRHIPRLTERFYRVDDGRSSDVGGTGLGLAIVKHVLMRHDAELRIHSTLGSGSKFICDFPDSRVASDEAIA